MGRIAFFTERLPPDDDPISTFSYDLIKNLADQQHEVRVFSTYREGSQLPETRSRIEILRPFKRWNWLELPKAIPLLVDFQPDVIHLVQPRAEALGGWTNAMSVLPTFSSLLGRPAVVASFYDLREEKLPMHRTLLLSSDVVTVSNRPQLELLENFYRLQAKRPVTAIVPVPSHQIEVGDDAYSERNDEFLRNFIDSRPKTIFVPGDLDEHCNVEILFETLSEMLTRFPEASVIFGGGWGDIPPIKRHQLMAVFERARAGERVLLSGPLSSSGLLLCLGRSQVVLLASLATTSLKLTQVLSEAVSSGAVLIFTEEQSLLAALPWRDRQNAFIVGRDVHSWSTAMAEALTSHELVQLIRSRLPDFARAEGLDLPANTMSRLYSEALERNRTTSRR